MSDNHNKESFTKPAYLKNDKLSNSEVDLYTALSIFVSNLLKNMGSIQDAIDSENIDKIEILMDRFQSQCKAVFLTKISEKIIPIREAISRRDIENVRKNFDNLHTICMDMTLSKPETVSMLVEMKEKFEESQTTVKN